jgi:hypothetical protein
VAGVIAAEPKRAEKLGELMATDMDKAKKVALALAQKARREAPPDVSGGEGDA